MSTAATSDLVFVVVILVSALIGLARGFFREILSLIIWGGACVAALSFGEMLGEFIGAHMEVPLSGALGFVGVFVAVLIAGALLQWAFAKLVASTGLTGTDRVLGFMFGGARGIVLCTVAIIALRPFFEDAPWWRESAIRPQFAKVERGILDLIAHSRERIDEPRTPGLPDADSPATSRLQSNLSHVWPRMEQIPIATDEVAYGASLSALGPVMLPNERLLNELNVPKGNPRMRTLFQFPEIVPCASSSRRTGLRVCMEQIPQTGFGLGGGAEVAGGLA